MARLLKTTTLATSCLSSRAVVGLTSSNFMIPTPVNLDPVLDCTEKEYEYMLGKQISWINAHARQRQATCLCVSIDTLSERHASLCSSISFQNRVECLNSSVSISLMFHARTIALRGGIDHPSYSFM
jgi:hypothetical protein